MNKGSGEQLEMRNKLAGTALSNYLTHLPEIEQIRQNIKLNRDGQIPLTAVALDGSKVSNRMAREEGMSMEDALERVNGVPNFQDVSIVRRMLRLSRSVCRVLVGSAQGNSGFGTGFMIAPRVMITNHHVLPDPTTAARSHAQFNYELNEEGRAMEPVTFNLLPNELFFTSSMEARKDDPLSGLDFTIVAVEERADQDNTKLDKFDFVKLDGGLGKILDGETCVVIQHPKGDYKKIVLKDIRMITTTENVLIYESDTHPGSSGSPVFGMGTAEVVALHHSGVPRTDANGNWLRKDGTPARASDPDDAIDWIGNEGIRVSRIVDAIRRAELPNGMDALRDTVLNTKRSEAQRSTGTAASPANTAAPAPPSERSSAPTPSHAPHSAMSDNIQRFELILAKDKRLRDAWRDQAPELVPGFVSTTQLFPSSTDDFTRRIHYLTLRSSDKPWKVAADIELLPHVEACTPDLPMATDAARPDDTGAAVRSDKEGLLPDVVHDDGTAEPNEKRFLQDWKDTPTIKGFNGDMDLIRRWNWEVVNWKGVWAQKGEVGAALKANLPKIRFTQLDTGYTDHRKVQGSLDLERDMNFVDGGADAFDPKHGWGFKHPGHGTRTGSVAVGRRHNEIVDDGNHGLLTDQNGTPYVKLIPYRVAERVVLLGSGKDMVDGARTAIESGTDVMFMCMGSHPRPMINAVAREAYERGVIWVCAAGNQVEMVVAPALYPGTIAVAAINPARQPWQGSSNGKAVDIAAPGEDVYVPFWDKSDRQIMCYGDGTSYATPHVASAAVLWKARHWEQLRTDNFKPWQVVEAFRHCLKATAAAHEASTKPGVYGAGVLDIQALLAMKLPKPTDLKHAYAGQPDPDPGDLGLREGLAFLWNTFKRKLTKDPTESLSTAGTLTGRGTAALEALGALPTRRVTESALQPKVTDRTRVLKELFEQLA